MPTINQVTATELVLARHGEGVCNVTGVAGGDQGCEGLTDRGRDQVAFLARRLVTQHAIRPFDVLYATPRRRVRESVQIVADALDLPVRFEPRLTGPFHGDADGKPWEEIRRRFGGAPADRPDEPFAPGAETWNEFLRRASGCLREILTREASRRLLVVAHGETVEAAHSLLLELPPQACTRIGFVVDHASLTRWAHRPTESGAVLWQLVAHNDTAHLPGNHVEAAGSAAPNP